MRVFVTGSSSHLAGALLPQLCASSEVECVTGIDLLAAIHTHPKFRAIRLDVRGPEIEALMRGHDALVHLAFVVLRGRMNDREMASINVDGSRQVFRAAREAGVRRLVHLSSAAIYGSGVNVDEGGAYAPLPGFLYAEHKAQVEGILDHEFPECVRLRPHVILGSHAQPLLHWLLDQPCYPRLPDPQPLLQCVHEDDVVRAIVLALTRDVAGPFNLAAQASMSFRDMIRKRHGNGIPIPLSAARIAAHIAWRMSGWGGEPAWIEGLAKTLTLDCRRARDYLGWEPAHEVDDMFAELS